MQDEVAQLSQTAVRYRRRLSDHILVAFHQACDQRDFEVAEQLLRVLETTNGRDDASGRYEQLARNVSNLVTAYERLWLLRHPPDN